MKLYFTREALSKSEEYNQKISRKTDLSVLDHYTATEPWYNDCK